MLARAKGLAPGTYTGGRIINIASMAAMRVLPQIGVYCTSKSAVVQMTKAMALEWGKHGINVNAVLPSIIDTPTNRADMPDADFSKWVSPQDLANAICFLASPEARAIHGALLPVTGLS